MKLSVGKNGKVKTAYKIKEIKRVIDTKKAGADSGSSPHSSKEGVRPFMPAKDNVSQQNGAVNTGSEQVLKRQVVLVRGSKTRVHLHQMTYTSRFLPIKTL